MEKNFKRTLVTTALPYANGRCTSVTWQACMFPPTSTLAISALKVKT